MPRTGRTLPWIFGDTLTKRVPAATYQCSDDFLAAVTLARAGVGLVQAYDFVVETELARGALVEVLRPFRGQSRPFSLVYPRDAPVTRATRAIVFGSVTRRVRTPAPPATTSLSIHRRICFPIATSRNCPKEKLSCPRHSSESHPNL